MQTLEEELDALADELSDPAEAEALVRLMELVADVAWQPTADDDYTPFVYPH